MDAKRHSLTDAQRLEYLAAMGIDVWLPLSASDSGQPADVTTAAVEPADWGALRQQVKNCTRCALHATRTQTVFGVGNTSADWMIIGEAPGAEEDRRGEPFVGRAGQLLDRMLAAIGLSRDTAYIANILKCRPPGNRDPHQDEADQCREYLERQIRLVQPRMILAVGRIAAQQLLGRDDAVGKLRGEVHSVLGIPLVVTYHPAYLLRSPANKAKAWSDLCLATRTLAESPA